jgi:hypothetical protein
MSEEEAEEQSRLLSKYGDWESYKNTDARRCVYIRENPHSN